MLPDITTPAWRPADPAPRRAPATCVETLEGLERRVMLAASDGDIVASGDFNNDGRRDIVVYRRNAGRYGGAQLRVFVGADRGLRRASTLQVGIVRDVAAGDFNNDGSIDLVVAQKRNEEALKKAAKGQRGRGAAADNGGGGGDNNGGSNSGGNTNGGVGGGANDGGGGGAGGAADGGGSNGDGSGSGGSGGSNVCGDDNLTTSVTRTRGLRTLGGVVDGGGPIANPDPGPEVDEVDPGDVDRDDLGSNRGNRGGGNRAGGGIEKGLRGNAYSLTILTGNGNGTFDAARVVASNVFGVSRIRVGDFNDDGNADLRVRARNINADGQQIKGGGRTTIAFFGEGDGTFRRGGKNA